MSTRRQTAGSYVKKGAKMEWISVEKELPKKDGCYLVASTTYGFVVRSFNVFHNCWDDEQADDYWCDAVGGKVTHWMPLPPPPSSHNSDYAKCQDLLKRAYRELEYIAEGQDLCEEIEKHFS